MKEFVRLLGIERELATRLGLAAVLGALAMLAAVGLTSTAAYLIARASQQPPILTLSIAIVAVRFFGISRGFARYGERLVAHDAALRILSDTRARVFERLEQLAPTGVAAYRSGDLLSRFVADVELLQDFYLRVVPPFAVAAITGAVSVALVAWLAPAAGLVLAAGLVVSATVVPLVAGTSAHRSAHDEGRYRGQLAAQVVELLRVSPELMAAGTAGPVLTRLGQLEHELLSARRTRAMSNAAGSGLGALVSGLSAVGCLFVGSLAVQQGRLQPVLLAVVALTPMAAFEAFAPLPQAVVAWGSVRAAATRVFAVIDAAPPVVEPTSPATLARRGSSLAAAAVAAQWNDSARPVLSDVQLTLQPGRTMGLVGPSGSGKSTLTYVLARFMDPTNGCVTLDQVDLRRLAEHDIRASVGLLAQQPHVFDTTLAQNLRVAAPQATDEQLWAALREARLDGWVRSLPDAMNTAVGEHGAQLSGGQRQRLATARSRLAQFPVLILDEPDEHVDPQTAAELMTERLVPDAGRATLVVSHRLTGLAAAGEICVLVDGRIVERGSHAQLVASNGWYATTLRTQQAADR